MPAGYVIAARSFRRIFSILGGNRAVAGLLTEPPWLGQETGHSHPRLLRRYVPTAFWHLLKRIYVDQDWPADTTLDQLNADARATIQADDTEIWCYGYYRTDLPRLQWGFFSSSTGIAVVYDDEADLIATVFKPVEGTRFFAGQLSAYRVDRREWAI